MEPNKLLDILHTAERLKDTLRHCDTSKGRRESVAEHSWRLALMAFFLRDEFPDTDMDRVIRMCLIHDLGECFTGDIPSFLKTDADTEKEDSLLELYKALDKLEAVIQHNEAPIATWLPREYDLNLIYANENVAFSPYLTELRAAIRRDTEEKIQRGE